jgi:hypothetical protein
MSGATSGSVSTSDNTAFGNSGTAGATGPATSGVVPDGTGVVNPATPAGPGGTGSSGAPGATGTGSGTGTGNTTGSPTPPPSATPGR